VLLLTRPDRLLATLKDVASIQDGVSLIFHLSQTRTTGKAIGEVQ
jgi:hypothetical protein